MHRVVATRELADEYPDLERAVYRGFCAVSRHFAKLTSDAPTSAPSNRDTQ